MNSGFRSLEWSDPAFESEGLRCATVGSVALGRRADMTVWLPPIARQGVAAGGRLPLIVLLHGAFGSHWAWAWKGGAHRLAARLIESGEFAAFALAMPSDGLWGDGSAYARHQNADYAAWIVEEVPRAAATSLGTTTWPGPVCLAGLSMGGFGAMYLAASHPGKFAAAAGHSSVTELSSLDPIMAEPLLASVGGDRSLLEVFRTNRATLPPIRFDCGVDDRFIEANRKLHRELVADGIGHVFEEFPGGHTWDYWQRHLTASLRFCLRAAEGGHAGVPENLPISRT